jgi:MinD superfamily P-loop ATPase
MQRVAELAAHFKVPGMVCVNKFDLNPEMTDRIEGYARERNMRLLGRIPFDPVFTWAMIDGRNVLEQAPDSQVADAIRKIWTQIDTSPAMNGLGIKDFSATIQ